MSHRLESAPAASDLRGLQTLVEPNRARIIELLGNGEHCVCDVGTELGLSAALVSHHLRVLHAAGLLHERRSGRWAYYALNLERLGQLRVALVEFLTPTDPAAAASACSDCGPTRVVAIVGRGA